MKDNNNHESTKKKLKIIGIILLAAGLTLSVIGFVNLIADFGSSMPPKLFFLPFIGIPLIGIGASVLLFAFRREILNYNKNESVPVINDASKDLSPTIETVANAFNEAKKSETVKCPVCKSNNPLGSKFCGNCGASLTAVCPFCGKENPADGKFCNHCGKKLHE